MLLRSIFSRVRARVDNRAVWLKLQRWNFVVVVR